MAPHQHLSTGGSSTPAKDLLSHCRRPSLPVAIGVALFLLITGALIQSQLEGEGVVAKRSIDVPDGSVRGKRPFKQRWFHLDLKGAPPRVSYLGRLFPLLSRLGVKGVVVEWEDAFPYEGRLSILKTASAYTRSDVEEILKLAALSSLEVIPLIQSFGHLEFVLKHDRFAHLRERVTEESSVCPSRNETIPLLREIIRQMRKAHPASTRIHIGADEAYYIGEDVLCRSRLSSEFDQNVERLKLDHIAKVARLALDEGFREVLAWNDMFDRAEVEMMMEVELGKLLTPVVWGYAVDVTREGYFPEGLFNRLSRVFPKIWFASAFKGANGAGNVFVEVDRYLANHRSYVELYRNFEKDLSGRLEGIILTGWSRFSHRQPLCELLPAALPSLVACLTYLNDVTASGREISEGMKDTLACPSSPRSGAYHPTLYNQSIYYPPKEQAFVGCVFPSSDLFEAMLELRFLHWKAPLINAEMERERVRHNAGVVEMESKLRPLLSAVIYDDAVQEFIMTHVRVLMRERPPPTTRRPEGREERRRERERMREGGGA